MFVSSVTERGAMPALVKTLVYNEARLRMISENVANIHTPGYRAKQLDAPAFQRALRKALDVRGGDPSRPLAVRVEGEVTTGDDGRLRVTPRVTPAENVLFHDGTNLSIEQQMADLAETGLMHDLATTLLRDRFESLREAIRGTVNG